MIEDRVSGNHPNIFQRPLFDLSLVGLHRCSLQDANNCLSDWKHKLGPCRRPFLNEAFMLVWREQPIATAISSSVISSTVAGYTRQEVVELSRLCTHPAYAWASRIMVRLWREVCAPLWPCWNILAAVSYSQNVHHSGNLYRFDGWEKVSDDAGSSGGGTWSTKRQDHHPANGKKTLWVWTYAHNGK